MFSAPQRGGSRNKPDDDMYIDDNNDNKAYIKQQNTDASGNGASAGVASVTVMSSVYTASIILSIYVWING